MALRIGILSAAHVHAPSYAHCINSNPRAELAGIWDDNIQRGERIASDHSAPFFGHLEDLFERVDAVAIASENIKHVELATKAAEQRKHILCEKPLATNADDAKQMIEAATAGGVTFMTALPCPFSPAFTKLQTRLSSGELGRIVAATTTNQGTCPFGWFVDEAASGGGALIDHTVHVAVGRRLRVPLDHRGHVLRSSCAHGGPFVIRSAGDPAGLGGNRGTAIMCAIPAVRRHERLSEGGVLQPAVDERIVASALHTRGIAR